MKINLPVTNVEYPFPKGKTLVSKTDLKGVIVYANDAFVEVSGFTREELCGKSHNVVRHPDMPPEVFEDFWKTLKAGRPWRGIIKNRRKNGDHYWVDALVVPVKKNGEVVSYMSVRKEPARTQVEQAIALYRALRENKAKLKSGAWYDFVYRLSFNARYALLMAAMALLPLVAGWSGLQGMGWMALGAAFLGVVLGVSSYAFMARTVSRPLRQAIGYFDQIAQGNLGNDIPIDEKDEAGQVIAALACTQAQLMVIIDEITLASERMQAHRTALEAEIERMASSLRAQQDQVMQVSAATEQVSVSVAEVAKSAGAVAGAAQASLGVVEEGNSRMSRSQDSTFRVAEAVQGSSQTIHELNQAIQKIGTITQIIEDIAEQTNLLALNAAIEAARAGEQGRGFAVVADEVRKLAERTTARTGEIAKTVERIQRITHSAVVSMDEALREVKEGRDALAATGESFQQVTVASRRVTEMAEHISSAAREQSSATENVAKNMERMSLLLERNGASIAQVESALDQVTRTAQELRELVARFSRGAS